MVSTRPAAWSLALHALRMGVRMLAHSWSQDDGSPSSHAELAFAQHAELTAASHESKDACSLHLSGTPAWSIRCSVPLPEIGTAAAPGPPSRRTSARAAGSMVKRRQTEQLRCAAAESRLPLR